MSEQKSTPYASAVEWMDDARQLFAGRIALIIEHSANTPDALLGGFVATSDALTLAHELSANEPHQPNENELLESLAIRLSDAASIREIPIGRLMTVFDLNPQLTLPLALLTVATRDARFAPLFAWLNDDTQRRVPTPAMLDRLCRGNESLVGLLTSTASALQRFYLVQLGNEVNRVPGDQPLCMSTAVSAWLAGEQADHPQDPILEGLIEDLPLVSAQALYPDSSTLLAADGVQGLTGKAGSGKTLLARAICNTWLIEAKHIPIEREKQYLATALRDAALSGRGLCVADANKLPQRIVRQFLQDLPCPLVLTAESRLPFEIPQKPAPSLDTSRARSLWAKLIKDEAMAERLSNQVKISALDICRVAAGTVHEFSALRDACLERSARALDELATKVELLHDWGDLVLPARQISRLHELAGRANHANRVFDDWGFAEKLVPNRGLSALFSGPSGTGKTLSASIVANSLQLPLYRVDLSATVSKYIGETEKNLEAIFTAAEAANAVLFFDECDALFGKRSEVSDAHDRYANIETSYLLQRMETHRGIVVLASNYPQNIDDAFARRIDVTVEFTLPDEVYRIDLWRRLLPEKANATIDAELLGRRFELTGGTIRNCLVTAAFAAAKEGVNITTELCIQAIAQEYEKSGRALTRAEFGDTYATIRLRTGKG